MHMNLRRRLSWLGALVMLSAAGLAGTATAASAQPAASLRPAATAAANPTDALSGTWAPTIAPPYLTLTESNGALTVDMSPLGRPNATGAVVDGDTITMTFPDDATYTGHITTPCDCFITWPNGPPWGKVYSGPMLFNLDGVTWSPGGGVTSDSGGKLTIDMSDTGRPTATGYALSSTEFLMHFPDDQNYGGTLESDGSIHWTGGSHWTELVIQ
jgi:hypothetical protein